MQMPKSMILAALTALSFHAHAAPPSVPYTFESQDGLVSVITAPAEETVWDHARALQQQLQAESESLRAICEQGEMSPARLLLAAVMPGGFIYAAFTRQRADQARQELDSLAVELAELDDDLRYWRLANTGIQVAMAD